ncbi:hypothetical protein SVAN01_00361 [Stagonosporopsis vannaccii]|nr:hypothetical protein SVAN01_00361 [Stagonosporopsis vannaccii]
MSDDVGVVVTKYATVPLPEPISSTQNAAPCSSHTQRACTVVLVSAVSAGGRWQPSSMVLPWQVLVCACEAVRGTEEKQLAWPASLQGLRGDLSVGEGWGISLTLKDRELAAASPPLRAATIGQLTQHRSHAAVPIVPSPTARMTKQGLHLHFTAA